MMGEQVNDYYSIIRMFVNINYQVILRNSNRIKGTIKAKIGEQLEDIKFKVLNQEGFKNQNSFIYDATQQQKVSLATNSLNILETSQNRITPKLSEKGSRKQSYDSLFEESSMDFQDQSKEFLASEPQKPPIVRGVVSKSNRFLCCFSSRLYLQLNITEVRIFPNNQYIIPDQTIFVNDIKKLRSYRKKQYFFIQMEQEDETMDFKFTNKNLCKEWMGYLMQAMTFNRYLNEKKAFSRAESFTKYLNSLNDRDHTQIVTLESMNQQLESIYQELPQQKTITRQSKKMIKISQFQIQYKIGKGSFSVIFWAKRQSKVVALKQLSKGQLLAKNQMKYALTELKVLTKCRACKYIIPIYYAFQTPTYLYMALKYIPTGDLGNYLKIKGQLSISDALLILTQLVFAIQFLHHQKIMYRDLKPDNILLDPQGHIYLIDFGLAKQLTNEQELAESFLGTPLYLAPERFTGSGSINFKSDIYGVGCIFYQMLHGESPFRGSNYHSLMHKIKTQTPQINPELPVQFQSFLKESLQKNPQNRLSYMSKHSIFKSTNWKQIAEKTQKGIAMPQQPKLSGVQINYSIDEDYTEDTFPSKYVSGWQFCWEDSKYL